MVILLVVTPGLIDAYGQPAAQPQSSVAVAPATTADLQGRLFRYVLSGAYEPHGAPRLVDDPSVPRGLRQRLQQFRERARRMRSRLAPPPNGPDPDGKDGFLGRQAIERGIVALIDLPAIEREAAAYASGAVDYYEYEGAPDGPLAEAAYAERYLASAPKTPLAPFLHLYLAVRYRTAFETHVSAGSNQLAQQSAHKYRTYLRGAKQSGDPLVRAAADDVDGQRFIYLEVPATPHGRKE